MRTRALVLLPVLAVVGCGSGAVDGPPGAENRLTLGEDGAPVLPNWATPDELGQPEQRRLRSVTQPPSAGFRVPAEYEPAKAVVITWTVEALARHAAHRPSDGHWARRTVEQRHPNTVTKRAAGCVARNTGG